MVVDYLKSLVREIPDFPKPGINFYDVTTLFRDSDGFRVAIDALCAPYRDGDFDGIVGIEARGFVIASAMAYHLGTGVLLVRKQGKLPHVTLEESYSLEYGEATLEVHDDAATDGHKLLVVDDLLATGGTAAATGRLLERLGATVVGYAFLIELNFLPGREALDGSEVFSLMRYDG